MAMIFDEVGMHGIGNGVFGCDCESACIYICFNSSFSFTSITWQKGICTLDICPLCRPHTHTPVSLIHSAFTTCNKLVTVGPVAVIIVTVGPVAVIIVTVGPVAVIINRFSACHFKSNICHSNGKTPIIINRYSILYPAKCLQFYIIISAHS